jgi:hypothetical protein
MLASDVKMFLNGEKAMIWKGITMTCFKEYSPGDNDENQEKFRASLLGFKQDIS